MTRFEECTHGSAALLALGLGLFILCAPPLSAQTAAATLIVEVRSAESGAPLRGAQVVVEGTGSGGVTDAQGRVRFRGLRAGSGQISARYLGYAPEARTVDFTAGSTSSLTLLLVSKPIMLAEVKVRPPAGIRRLFHAGFYRRKMHGPGAFLTRSQIEQRNPQRLSDMLRNIPGLRLTTTQFGDGHASMSRAVMGRRCPIQYYMDGVLTHGLNIDDVLPRDVEGLEIYRGSSEIPPDYNRGTALCGVILIWTRVD